MNIKNNPIIFIYLLSSILQGTPPLTAAQQLNIAKKTLAPSKKAPTTKKATPPKPVPIKKNIPPLKKATPATKVTVVTNLNELTKALEKFQADQQKLRSTNRSNPCNQYVNIQDKCACTGVSCTCPVIPKLLAI